jgi:hypothetical protein
MWRLMRHGMIRRHDLRIVNHGSVYSLTPAGASELIGRGEYYMRQPSSLAALAKKVHHALELNEIHLALKRTGMLVRWTPESEIRSSNELTSRGYVKDYDAVITVRVDGQECRFALEYERSPKDRSRYKAIQERIERETRVHHFLYLLPSHDLLLYVMRSFLGSKRAVHFGLSRDFLAETLNLQVQSTQSPISMMLRTALSDGRLPERTCSAPA